MNTHKHLVLQQVVARNFSRMQRDMEDADAQNALDIWRNNKLILALQEADRALNTSLDTQIKAVISTHDIEIRQLRQNLSDTSDVLDNKIQVLRNDHDNDVL